jgi:hypothetical protein
MPRTVKKSTSRRIKNSGSFSDFFKRKQTVVLFAAIAIIGAGALIYSFAATSSVQFSGKLTSRAPTATHTVSPTLNGTLTASLTFDTKKVQGVTITLRTLNGTTIGSQSSNISPVVLNSAVNIGDHTITVQGNGTIHRSGASYTLNVTYPVPDPVQPPTDPNPTPEPPATGWWKPPRNTKWQWVLEGSVNVSSTELNRFDMYDIDMSEAMPYEVKQDVVYSNGERRTVTWPKGSNAAAFNTLKASGKKVICYFSTGAFETYRADASLFPGTWGSRNDRTDPYTLQQIPYNGPSAYASQDVIGQQTYSSADTQFTGEHWLNIREANWNYFAPIMFARLEVAKRIGCDGVEGDQNNVYDNDTALRITQAESLRWYREIYYQTHIRNLTAISKNGIEITSQQVNFTNPSSIPYCTTVPGICEPDGVLNEECEQYRECQLLDPAISKGLWVGQVEYRGTRTSVCTDANAKGRMTMKKPENYSVTSQILFACWE